MHDLVFRRGLGNIANSGTGCIGGAVLYFVIGALIGMGQMLWRFIRKPFDMNYPVQGFAFSAALGAASYGTILWLIFG